jgi:hypothetical protein
MAAENWQQKFLTNPITTNQTGDLLYFARSPYGITNDAVISWNNFSAQFTLSSPALSSIAGLTTIANNLIFTTAANTYAVTTPVNNAVLVSSAGGTPSFSTTLPSGLTIPGYTPSTSLVWRPGAGTNSGIGGDGTATATALDSLVYGSASCTDGGGPHSFVYGSASTGTTGASYSFIFGDGCSLNAGAVTGNFVFGTLAKAGGTSNLSFGISTTALGINNFVMGNHASSVIGSVQSISFGSATSVAGANQFAFGVSSQTLSTAVAGFGWAIGNTAISTNSGSYVWGDAVASPVTDTAVNQWVQTFAGGYKWYINNTPTLALSIDTAGNVTNSRGSVDLSKVILTPTTGTTITLATINTRTLLNPAGTLAALTINMPAAPVNGQIQRVTSSQIITVLTISGNGHTLVGGLTTLSLGGSFTYIYDTATTTWYPG